MTAQLCHNPRTSHDPGSCPAFRGDAVKASMIARAAAQRRRASASHDYSPRTTLIANVVGIGFR